MATNRDHENLSKENMKKVILALETEKPITKKAACEILNISYNTTRLKKLIDEFKDREESSKRLRKQLRGTPVTLEELTLIAQEYLNNTPMSAISEMTYRPVSLIKKKILEMNIPERSTDYTYKSPPLLEEGAIAEDYVKDDLVYSAQYQVAALVERQLESRCGPVYIIYLLGKEQCYATQPYWELADLRRVQKELKVTITPLQGMNPSYNPPNKG